MKAYLNDMHNCLSSCSLKIFAPSRIVYTTKMAMGVVVVNHHNQAQLLHFSFTPVFCESLWIWVMAGCITIFSHVGGFHVFGICQLYIWWLLEQSKNIHSLFIHSGRHFEIRVMLYSQHYSCESQFTWVLFIENTILCTTIIENTNTIHNFLVIRIDINFSLFSKFLPMKLR